MAQGVRSRPCPHCLRALPAPCGPGALAGLALASGVSPRARPWACGFSQQEGPAGSPKSRLGQREVCGS